jgi:hypothetical protein
MEGIKFKAEKSFISMLTGALGIYMTAAMWFEFNDALGFYFGPSMGIIIGTVVFMIYQSNKNIKEFSFNGNYNTSERTQFIRHDDGEISEADGNMEPGRNAIGWVAIMYLLVVVFSEITWSDLIL